MVFYIIPCTMPVGKNNNSNAKSRIKHIVPRSESRPTSFLIGNIGHILDFLRRELTATSATAKC